MAIKDIAGNPLSKDILLSIAMQEKQGRAYIFTGEEEIGKSFAALQFAKAINCINPGTNHDSCDACRNCTLLNKVFADLDEDGMQKNPHPDILYVNTEKAQLSIELVRDKLNEMNSYGRIELKKKTVIINDAEKMNKEAANSILKELEEPHDNVIIILLVNNIEKILPTIISRCYKIELKRTGKKEIESKLRALMPDWDEEKILEAAEFAEGKIGAALHYEEIKEEIKYTTDIFRKISSPKTDIGTIFESLQYIEAGKKASKTGGGRMFLLDILKILSYIYKDLILEKLGIKELLSRKYGLIKSEIRVYSIRSLANIISLIESAQRDLMQNANISLLFTNLFFNIRKEG